MSVIYEAVLPFVGILIGLVVLHELGHFVVAKLAGVRVEEFGVGMPPRIWGKRFGETLYSINWLPLGGFVRLTGEESARVIVAAVNRHGAAESAGLRPGDAITAVGKAAVHNEEQLAAHLRSAVLGGPFTLTVQREEASERGRELFEYDFQIDRPGAGFAGDDVATDNTLADDAASPAAVIGGIAGLQVTPDPRSLGSKPRPVRIAVMAAGAGVNAILPILLFAIAAMIPQDQSAGPAVITSVTAGAPAAEAGLQTSDRFVSINGEAIQSASDVARMIQLNLGEDLAVVVERDVVAEATSQQGAGRAEAVEVIETTVHARLAPEPLRHVVQPGETVHEIADRLGVTTTQVLAGAGLGGEIDLSPGLTLEIPGEPAYITGRGDTVYDLARDFGVRTQVILDAAGIDLVNLEAGTLVEVPQGATGITIANGSGAIVKTSEGFFAAIGTGWDQTIETLIVARNRIRSWIAGGEGIELTGPIGIAQTTGEVVEAAGWLRLIELAALLSLNLAIINILPLPMLDGGRIVFVLIEIARRGKRISPEKEGLVHLAGFALLIMFVIIVSYFDIVRAVSGDSLLR